MIQVSPGTRILVAVEPVDFRKGIDGLARVCRLALASDPFTGAVFVFRNRCQTTVKILAYDGQGFWLCQKRFSKGKFAHWPAGNGAVRSDLLAHQLQLLLAGGDPDEAKAAPQWRPIQPTLAA